MRKKRTALNLLFGILGQVITIALGLIVPRLFIVTLGSETNGLVSSVNEIYSYIQLLEAGIGAATIQALFSPVARNDRQKINGILSATSIYYKKVAKGYLLCMVLCSIGYPLLISSDLPRWQVTFVFFTSGIGNVINFWVQGKYKQLLTAEGKVYITTNIATIVTCLTYGAKITLLLLGQDIIAIQIANCIISFFPMIILEIYIKKKYQWLDISQPPDFASISQKNAVLTHQISGLVFNHTDVLVLTIFCGLKVVSVYTLYNMMYNVVEKVINMLSSSISSELGQLLQSDREKFEKVYSFYEFAIMSVSTMTGALLLCFNETFIRLYTFDVKDICYIVPYVGILFAIYKLTMWLRMPITNVVSWAGHYRQTQPKAVGEAVVNLAVSLFLVKPLGMQGILCGSIAAAGFGLTYITFYAAVKIDKAMVRQSISRMLRMAIVVIITACVPLGNYIHIQGYAQLMIAALIVTPVVALALIVINAPFEKKLMKMMCNQTMIVVVTMRNRKK